MKLQDWTESEVERLALSALSGEEAEVRYVFFYTPLCGTCKVGERMLEIVLELDPQLPLVKCNVNACRRLPYEWKIESVPCLMRLESGAVQEKRYRMASVDELFRFTHPK